MSTSLKNAAASASHVSQVDVNEYGYDTRFYHNSCKTILKIIGVFILYYIFVFSFWWACFGLGITDSTLYTNFSLGCFGFSVFVIICMVISGNIANGNKIKAEEMRFEGFVERQKEEDRKQREAYKQKKLEEMKNKH